MKNLHEWKKNLPIMGGGWICHLCLTVHMSKILAICPGKVAELEAKLLERETVTIPSLRSELEIQRGNVGALTAKLDTLEKDYVRAIQDLHSRQWPGTCKCDVCSPIKRSRFPVGQPCCQNEKRSVEGGCENCGDPAL